MTVEDEVQEIESSQAEPAKWFGMPARLGAFVIGGIAIAGIVLMCLTVLLLVLLADN